MSRRAQLAVLVMAWLACLMPISASGEDLDVRIASPLPAQPTFGEVDFVAQLLPGKGQLSHVEFLVDGDSVGQLQSPPYRLRVDVGTSNQQHRFEVRLHGEGRILASALLVSPAIRSDSQIDVALQQLYVTVRNDQQRLLDLDQSEFTIRDNGVKQKLVTFARGDVRLTAALLVDASMSMRGRRLQAALGGARAFINGMNSGDQASVMVFSDQLLHNSPFANDAALTDLNNLQASGGTALNDHLYLALKRLEQQQGRRVLILLTDGIDSHSTLRMHEVAWLQKRSQALIYWIHTAGGEQLGTFYSAWKNPTQFRSEYLALKRTVEDSGGRIVPLERFADIDSAFQDILMELRQQYVLGFYPHLNRDDGSWHRIEVRVRRSNARLRTQAGYIDY